LKLFFLFLIISITQFLNASSAYVLGSSNHQIPKVVKTKNSIVWSKQSSAWFASEPTDKINFLKYSLSFILLNDDTINYTAPVYNKDSYRLKKGWNSLNTPKNGVDIVKTFQNLQDVKFVFVYDKLSHAWAGYSPDKNIDFKIKQTRILSLKYIESNIEYFVYTSRGINVDILNSKVNKVCQKFIDSKEFNTLIDSIFSKSYTNSNNDNIGIKTRYFSHHKRGEYSDSRTLLIYPKIKLQNKTKQQKYGAALPKILVSYDVKYEDKEFYIYNYFDKNCYKGVFPSKKTPPFSTLIKL